MYFSSRMPLSISIPDHNSKFLILICTLNPNLQSQSPIPNLNPKSQSPNPKSPILIANPQSQISNHQSKSLIVIPNPKQWSQSKITNPQPHYTILLIISKSPIPIPNPNYKSKIFSPNHSPKFQSSIPIQIQNLNPQSYFPILESSLNSNPHPKSYSPIPNANPQSPIPDP